MGVTSERDLFPAPPEFEDFKNFILRKQYESVLNDIQKTTNPIIIHAEGGVGKSVFAQQIVNSLSLESLGIVYDCFGGGRYRNRSETRHRHRDGLVQIANELAIQGLCSPLIAQSTALEDEILRKFIARIRMAVKSLRKGNKDAILAIIIDAADNAEMAAHEFNQSCFVHELLRENLPEGCRLIALCRTERIDLLQPKSSVSKIKLKPFSQDETLEHLRKYFPQATESDGLEFHRLTNGNPRVQANVLCAEFNKLSEVLGNLGPSGITVEQQINLQLDTAINKLEDRFPIVFQDTINAICIGLATLPPFIPLEVLATVAEVNIPTVKSFVADLGRPLWLSDSSVQFRDEPTETWFRETFSATKEQITSYVKRLKPLACKYSYVAETLPSLLLQAEEYDELIELALSNKYLPMNNLIDKRNIRIYRLQFAFKAALKLKRYEDAIKLALRAGEEMAGDKRQLEILKKNVDLIAPLQNKQRIQELAYRCMLQSDWDGSENVYTASLLSSVNDFKGEARGYLRAAKNWLQLYFEERKKNKDKYVDEKLTDEDIVEMVFAHYNLFGISKTVEFILSWRPAQVVYRIASKFAKRLIDKGNFDVINQILNISFREHHLKNQYLVIALVNELMKVGRIPNKRSLEPCLILLSMSRTRIQKPDSLYYNTNTIAFAIISFLEACSARELQKVKILRVLRHYFPIRASVTVSSNYQSNEREIYLRAIALKHTLLEEFEPDLDDLLPSKYIEKNQNNSRDVEKFKEIIGGLLPWYITRARIVTNKIDNLFDAIENSKSISQKARAKRYLDNDVIPYEITRILLEIIMFYKKADSVKVKKFFNNILNENQYIMIKDRLNAVRVAFRLEHLSVLRKPLEKSAYEVIFNASDEGPDARSNWYIDLARAVFPLCREDAAAYFNYAIEAVSKFGDEIVQRWGAIVELANKCAEGNNSPKLAYRFIRCAELVGDSVAREKYFDRNGAVKICTRLSPVSALAALSRWRDRDVGWFKKQTFALAYELVNSSHIDPSVGWSLSAFFNYRLDDFTTLCIEKERIEQRRKYILDKAIHELRINEASVKSWRKLKKITQQYSLNSKKLDNVLKFYENNADKYSQEDTPEPYHQDKLEVINWGDIFNAKDLTSSTGIDKALQLYKEAPRNIFSKEQFWNELLKRIDDSNAVKFLYALVNVEEVSIYDIEDVFSSMPEDWNIKASVRRKWGDILKNVGQRFAYEFLEYNTLDHFLKGIQGGNNTKKCICQGIFKGLSSNRDLADANTFFGFVKITSNYVLPRKAKYLLEYALNRFELHIDDKYADGCWSNWLEPSEDIREAFTGFIWSALGSPQSEIRWCAAHCVKRLSEGNCNEEIDALIEWMERDKVNAFGSKKFPFYNLHARLYLLIALARVSVDNPSILKNHYNIFSHHALGAISHILIQKFSADIAINIEKAYPNTYRKDIVEQLNQIGVSQLPIKEIDRYEDTIDSYYHKKGKIDTSINFNHPFDFNRYWFEPLGEVFGISSQQVEQLANDVIINKWCVNYDGSFQNDPRSSLWRNSQNRKDTFHSHYSYPRVDKYNFYLSYHALFVVASKLIKKMPVIKSWDWCEDAWAEWLEHHLLTRNDGFWLADRRDPPPLLKPDWINKQVDKNRRSEIKEMNFLDAILFKNGGETWMNIFGSWEEGNSQCKEDIYVSSALVSPAGSQSLLNALTTCSNPHDYKLPNYQEKDMEFNEYPFTLKGWVYQENKTKRLDEFDPYAGKINYPPFQIGQTIIEKLSLTVDSELREWYLHKQDRPDLYCQIWSTDDPNKDEDPLRSGNRLSASLSFLKRLCLVMQCELVLEVQINRRFKQTSYWRSDDSGYQPPFSRIYILSADGKLRDERKNYKLR